MSVLKLNVASRVLRPSFAIASIAALLASASVSWAQLKSGNINVSYVDFTGSASGFTATQSVLSWTYSTP
jgi:hypothetical protein